MNESPSYVPQGHGCVTPYLVIQNAAEAIDYYKTVFNAEERVRLAMPDGKIGHAQLIIGDSVIMISDECSQMGSKGPKAYGGSPVRLYVYVENVDLIVDRALAHGATLIFGTQDHFYGDRTGSIIDPFGHIWTLATRVEDVSPAEIQKRAAAMMACQAS